MIDQSSYVGLPGTFGVKINENQMVQIQAQMTPRNGDPAFKSRPQSTEMDQIQARTPRDGPKPGQETPGMSQIQVRTPKEGPNPGQETPEMGQIQARTLRKGPNPG